MNNYIITTRKLTKNYGNKLAIDNLDIDISSNKIIGLIGKNGSGKTTLLKILAGQLDASNGEVKVFSENPIDNLKALKRLVYIYHNYEYLKGLVLSAILSQYNEMFDNFDMDFSLKLLSYFNLKPSMKYNQLSQGMASTFNFICGLSSRAELTMFDEPVLGMDVSIRKSVYEVLLRDYSAYPRTFIISSHLISEIEGILSDIVLIDEGKLILNEDIESTRAYAYRIDGTKHQIEEYILDKDVLYSKVGNLSSYAIIRASITDDVKNQCLIKSLELSPVRTEDLFVYLTKQNKEDELECLWEMTK